MKCFKHMLSLDFILSAVRSHLIRPTSTWGPLGGGMAEARSQLAAPGGPGEVVMVTAPQLRTPEQAGGWKKGDKNRDTSMVTAPQLRTPERAGGSMFTLRQGRP